MRGLYTCGERGRLVEAGAQTDPWRPDPVRIEVPIEVPDLVPHPFNEQDFRPLEQELIVSQYGEHVHATAACEGLKKSTSRLRQIIPCQHCFGQVQLYS